MQKKFLYPMNVVAKDVISGFEGVIIARSAHLFGCAQYGLAPRELASDGSTKNTEYFDEARIEIIDNSNAVYGNDNFENIFAISLGSEVQDKVTNFTGKVVVAIEYLHNCNQYYIQPSVDKEGKPRDGIWCDEGRLVIVGKGVSPEEVSVSKRGSVFSRDLPRR